MKKVVIYSKDYCPWCDRAKDLLKNKGYNDITEIDITNSGELQAECLEKSGGRRTVPQIFLDGKHIGGHDDLVEYFKNA
jgi:glutaredoxin 3